MSSRLGKKGVKVPDYAQKNPEYYYYDPRTGKYPRRLGFPVEEGAGHGIPCFPAGTFIATPAGGRLIELLRAGDSVLAFSEAKREVVVRRVLEVHTSAAEWLYRVRTATGEVRATGDHLFWVGPGEYVAARDLGAGQALHSLTGERLPVLEVVAEQGPVIPTWNFTVDGEFNYFAGDERVLVHNEGPFGIYLGRDPLTKEIIYVGQTEQNLTTRQSQHNAEAIKEPAKYGFKKGMVLEWARGPDGKLLTNLSADEAFYWERMIYDRELAAGKKLGNLQVPYTDEKMAELVKKNCPR
ncbi:MAG: polymorphic toxin-type HINT domain-containing protein [Myxococcota bacterium]